MDADRPSLWDFSLAVYARTGVADACLALQDRHGADVNLLLFCLWWACHGGGWLTAAELDSARAAAGAWQLQVVVPLRAVRRALKVPLGAPRGPAEKLRQRVKDVELEAERLEQSMLAASFAASPAAPPAVETALASAAANLRDYLAGVDLAAGSTDRAAVAAILAGCFADAARARIEAALS